MCKMQDLAHRLSKLWQLQQPGSRFKIAFAFLFGSLDSSSGKFTFLFQTVIKFSALNM